MAETYLEITQQIEALKQKAETIRESEIAGVIERIRAAIEAYGLTADQLFTAPAAPRNVGTGKRKPGRASPSGAKGSGPRYRDEAGNSWSGRGPRPRWVKAALEAGKSMDDFAVVGSPRVNPGRPTSVPKYKDDQGHSWSGRGPRPGWVKAALAAGKTLEQLT